MEPFIIFLIIFGIFVCFGLCSPSIAGNPTDTTSDNTGGSGGG
uniref:Uncharacterized protein n=1 Tax=viral metagenome TaxID=1070528 RepID=A0A6C0JC92_9ZZZZ